MRSGCGSCGRICNPLPGGSGHRPGRHYDRSARCLAHLGGGEGPTPRIRVEARKGRKPWGLGNDPPKRKARPGIERWRSVAEASAAVERREASVLRSARCGIRRCRQWMVTPFGALPPSRSSGRFVLSFRGHRGVTFDCACTCSRGTGNLGLEATWIQRRRNR
jgi:hypothetical protein